MEQIMIDDEIVEPVEEAVEETVEPTEEAVE